jgi:hypothetical protein
VKRTAQVCGNAALASSDPAEAALLDGSVAVHWAGAVVSVAASRLQAAAAALPQLGEPPAGALGASHPQPQLLLQEAGEVGGALDAALMVLDALAQVYGSGGGESGSCAREPQSATTAADSRCALEHLRFRHAGYGIAYGQVLLSHQRWYGSACLVACLPARNCRAARVADLRCTALRVRRGLGLLRWLQSPVARRPGGHRGVTLAATRYSSLPEWVRHRCGQPLTMNSS